MSARSKAKHRHAWGSFVYLSGNVTRLFFRQEPGWFRFCEKAPCNAYQRRTRKGKTK